MDEFNCISVRPFSADLLINGISDRIWISRKLWRTGNLGSIVQCADFKMIFIGRRLAAKKDFRMYSGKRAINAPTLSRLI